MQKYLDEYEKEVQKLSEEGLKIELKKLESYVAGCNIGEISDVGVNIDFTAAKVRVCCQWT